jgi:DNA-binding XRE family transcriptional regulator
VAGERAACLLFLGKENARAMAERSLGERPAEIWSALERKAIRRVGLGVSFIGKLSFWQSWWLFLLVFGLFAVFFALLYRLLPACCPRLFQFSRGELCWSQAFYFSFTSQLTVEAGDVRPEGWSQGIAIIQSIIGVGLFGVWAGLAVNSLMSAHPKTVLFANWAGYDLSTESFFVVFVNRNVENLVDVRVSSIVKLADFNPVRTAVNPPYIGSSVWPYGVTHVRIAELATLHLMPGDGIKFGVAGKAGVVPFAYSRKYGLENIHVQLDRDYSHNWEFAEPSFGAQFHKAFNNPKESAIPLLEFDFEGYWEIITDIAQSMMLKIERQGHIDGKDLLSEVEWRFGQERASYVNLQEARSRETRKATMDQLWQITTEKAIVQFEAQTGKELVWDEFEGVLRYAETEQPSQAAAAREAIAPNNTVRTADSLPPRAKQGDQAVSRTRAAQPDAGGQRQRLPQARSGNADLRAAREQAGLTQAALAKAVGVHPTTVGKWEREGRPPGSGEVRAKVAEVLGFDPWAEADQEVSERQPRSAACASAQADLRKA